MRVIKTRDRQRRVPVPGYSPLTICAPLPAALQWLAMKRQQKITHGEMRSSEVRNLLIYCGDYKCAHWIPMNADPWPDDVRLSDLEPLCICRARGDKGANVRTDSLPLAWDSLTPNKKDRASMPGPKSIGSSQRRSSTAAYSLPVVWRFYKTD